MAAEQNLAFTLGETWEIDFALNDADGADLNLTGASVKFRLSRRGVLCFELTTDGDDVAVDSPSGGLGSITVTPAAQGALYAAVFDYEVRAVLADGRVTTQDRGALTIEGTLF
jgi:hypothetical protein